MADARRREVTKTRQITETYTEVDGVVLELTEFETVTLRALVGAVGGASPYRDAMSGIYNKLAALGYTASKNSQVSKAIEAVDGVVFFN